MRILFFLLVAACDMTPNYVDTKDIEQAVASRTWGTVCKGLEMKEERIRRYATEQLWKAGAPAEELDCICEHISTPDGGWDAAIAEGLIGLQNDTIVGCFADLVKNPKLPKRTEAVVALAQTSAPIARAALADIASAEGDIEARARAAEAIGGDPKYKDALMSLLSHEDKGLRAAAAKGLGSGNRNAGNANLLYSTSETTTRYV